MPIQIDKKPGRKPLRRNGEPVGTIPAPGGPDFLPATLRVRMLREIRSKIGVFAPGKSYDLELQTARSWIGFGFAEEDKSFDHAPETK